LGHGRFQSEEDYSDYEEYLAHNLTTKVAKNFTKNTKNLIQ